MGTKWGDLCVPSRQSWCTEPESREPLQAAAQDDQPRAQSEARPAAAAPRTGASYEDALGRYRRAFEAVSRAFEAAAMQPVAPDRLPAAMADVERSAVELVDASGIEAELLRLALGPYLDDNSEFVVPHGVNVAVLSILVADEMGLSRGEIIELAVTGLVHDIGSVRLPAGMLHKADPLDPAEWQEIRQRPLHGADIVAALGEPWTAVATTLKQVYERLDGSGYPMGLEGDDLVLGARILGAVDFLETYVHPRPYLAGVTGTAADAVKSLMHTGKQHGQDVLKALVRRIGLFPPGTYVRLSSGEIALVVESRKVNPMRPVVRVLRDRRRHVQRSGAMLDLVETPHVYIAGSLSHDDVDGLVDFFGQDDPGDREPRRQEAP